MRNVGPAIGGGLGRLSPFSQTIPLQQADFGPPQVPLAGPVGQGAEIIQQGRNVISGVGTAREAAREAREAATVGDFIGAVSRGVKGVRQAVGAGRRIRNIFRGGER